MNPRLAWIYELQASVNSATGGQIKDIKVEDCVDPLKKKVILDLHENWQSEDYHPFCFIAAFFAELNECKLYSVAYGDKQLILQVFLKRRLGPEMKKNPFFDG